VRRFCALVAGLVCLGSGTKVFAENVVADTWHRILAKSGAYAVDVPCTPEDSANLALHTQKYIPPASRYTVDVTCYSDRALFTAQTASIANPKSRFAGMWDAASRGTFGVQVVLTGGRRAIDDHATIAGNDAIVRYIETAEGGYIALSVERIALDEIKQDADRYFASFVSPVKL
jgi:hypothetical protein